MKDDFVVLIHSSTRRLTRYKLGMAKKVCVLIHSSTRRLTPLFIVFQRRVHVLIHSSTRRLTANIANLIITNRLYFIRTIQYFLQYYNLLSNFYFIFLKNKKKTGANPRGFSCALDIRTL